MVGSKNGRTSTAAPATAAETEPTLSGPNQRITVGQTGLTKSCTVSRSWASHEAHHPETQSFIAAGEKQDRKPRPVLYIVRLRRSRSRRCRNMGYQHRKNYSRLWRRRCIDRAFAITADIAAILLRSEKGGGVVVTESPSITTPRGGRESVYTYLLGSKHSDCDIFSGH